MKTSLSIFNFSVKKVFAYICVLAGVTAMAVSSSSSVSNRIWNWNNKHALNDMWWGKHNSKGGGLASMAYLDDIKKFEEPKAYHFIAPPDNGVKNMDVYVFGDSYTEDVPGYAFANTHDYHYCNYIKGLTYDLDTSKRNVLIIEVSERLFLERYSDYGIFDRLKRKEASVANAAATPEPQSEAPKAAPVHHSVNKNFSLVVNKNLEYVLFDYNFINVVRRLKADLNYTCFNRASGDVAIAENGKYIFYKPTIMPNSAYSVYRHISDTVINNVVGILNDIYDHYRKEGFTEVYFSPLPNTATILQPENYNGLIPRITGNRALKMPVFDMYSIFKKSSNPEQLFQEGDTHWNNGGMQIWLGLVNAELRRKSGE